MDCSNTTWISNEEYLKRFSEKTYRLRIPVSGGIEITRRCNLRCIHCYVGPQAAMDGHAVKEMNTARIMSIVDEIADAGCLYLLITGGEPLLRKDFVDIYRYIKSKGILVTIFTNGTLITEETAELLTELPPRAVEISLYGASEATYESITGVAGSFMRCMKGIGLLLDHGVKNVKLKTILMTVNKHEFFDIENLANKLGLTFRFDAAIFPRLNGDKAPLGLRVSPDEAIEKEFSTDERLQSMQDYFAKFEISTPTDKLYVCGAGVTNFHIDPYGVLQPCLMSMVIKYDLCGGSFLDCWNNVVKDISERKAAADYVCNGCRKRALCGFCPAFFNLENGSEHVRSEYLCAMGAHRFDVLHKNIIGGYQYGN